MDLKVNEFFEQVQGSDELQSEFITAFTGSDFGKTFLGKYQTNNTPQHFKLDDSGKIIPESVDDKIGELIGFERKKVHESRDSFIKEATGVEPKEGEGKGFAKRAIEEWKAKQLEEAKIEPNQQLQSVKEAHKLELQSIIDGSKTTIGEWEQKYNDLQEKVIGAEKDNLLNKELSNLGIPIADLDKFQQAYLNLKITEAKGMLQSEEGKFILKDVDGKILRKPNQDELSLSDWLTEHLSDLKPTVSTGGGGGQKPSGNGASGGGQFSNFVENSSRQSEVTAKFDEFMQRKGISVDSEEYVNEFRNLREANPAYEKLPT